MPIQLDIDAMLDLMAADRVADAFASRAAASDELERDLGDNTTAPPRDHNHDDPARGVRRGRRADP